MLYSEVRKKTIIKEWVVCSMAISIDTASIRIFTYIFKRKAKKIIVSSKKVAISIVGCSESYL
jgi:uncharacterized membrane protein